MRFLLLVVSLLSWGAFAQRQVCQDGVNCRVASLQSTGPIGTFTPAAKFTNCAAIVGSFRWGQQAANVNEFGLWTDAGGAGPCPRAGFETLAWKYSAATAVMTVQGTVNATTHTSTAAAGANGMILPLDVYLDFSNGAGTRSIRYATGTGTFDFFSSVNAFRFVGNSGLVSQSTVQLGSASVSTNVTMQGGAFVGGVYTTPNSAGTAGSAARHFTSNTADKAPYWSAGDYWRRLAAGIHPAFDGSTLSYRPAPESAVCPLPFTNAPSSAAIAPVVTCTDSGVASFVSPASTVKGRPYRTSAAGAVAANLGQISGSLMFTGYQGPQVAQWVRTDATITNLRYWVGMGASLPVSATGNSLNTNQAGFRFSTSVPDTNWQACSMDGTTNSCTDTALAVVASHEYLTVIDRSVAGHLYFYIYDATAGTEKFVDKTTNLPGLGSFMQPWVSVETLGGAVSHFLGVGPVAIEAR